MSDRLKGSFNVFTLIPVFHDNSGWWAIEPTDNTYVDISQSDLDAEITFFMEKLHKCQALIVVHKAFAYGEFRTFVNFVDCDEQVLIELLKNGKLKELI